MLAVPVENPAGRTPAARPAEGQRPWWRDAVVYQVYIRSFLDSTGDGVGDLAGVRVGLPYVRKLGVDGIWLSPFYPSPQHDHGYDVADYSAVDPLYGDLAEFDRLVADAHRLGLKVVIDVVPNHCSSAHPWFRAALADGPGGPARSRFHFADGRGEHGELPPNNWRAMFGGPAWSRVKETDGSPGQWYLHLFTPEQPDLNWRDPRVGDHFEEVLRFWLDRGVDGFRIDVAAGLFRHPELPDSPDPEADERTRDSVNPLAWNQPEVHDVWRRWRALCESYTAHDGQDRLLVGEVSVPTAADQALYVRPDELHQAFFFHLLSAPWNAADFRRSIVEALRDIAGTGSTVTWVLNNHDQVRTVTRYDADSGGVGATRARAAALLMLALPGAAYIYQGEELGLPEVLDLPDDALTDPIFRRTGSRRYVRDGCRVPLPWSGHASPFGFTAPGSTVQPWLPQPAWFAEHTTDRALSDTGSFWHLYRDGLNLREQLPQLGEGSLRWLESPPQVLAFVRGDGMVCAVNFGEEPVPAPVPGPPLLASAPCPAGLLPGNTAAWWVCDLPAS
ncbi:glycoside hydrolase family 13 protein [Streptomyces sp. SID13666]|uniref:glycoside hydrolase family 13 protein n=1 Tax=unclassified Streptomyces TaxID=2593676 RepID=UPI0013BF0410|nr:MULTISPECIES: glycoside hydrolase family 13 protein [unclassified Streptomyces]MCZ4102968.1 glycoside hydrolase family 13 protein [Streptomyces sp. H39-C1]NEA54603.1 glycoside hydrolase family 13 protein [Streptomyces sp. SID13666]NEA70392.1 glycoside hydrolase family 13 protein [Streptomyces sp. SID13588]